MTSMQTRRIPSVEEIQATLVTPTTSLGEFLIGRCPWSRTLKVLSSNLVKDTLI